MRRLFFCGVLLIFIAGVALNFKYFQLAADYLNARYGVADVMKASEILQGGELRSYGVRFYYKGGEDVLKGERLYVVYGCGDPYLSKSLESRCANGRLLQGELLFGHRYLLVGGGVYMIWGSFNTGFFGVY